MQNWIMQNHPTKSTKYKNVQNPLTLHFSMWDKIYKKIAKPPNQKYKIYKICIIHSPDTFPCERVLVCPVTYSSAGHTHLFFPKKIGCLYNFFYRIYVPDYIWYVDISFMNMGLTHPLRLSRKKHEPSVPFKTLL